MKNIYKSIWEEIKKHKKITIITHIDSDGDTIGSAVALKHLILLNTDIKEVKISSEKPPRYISFLDESEQISDQYFNNSLKIVVDTSTLSRIYDQRVITEESIKIDHHHKENKWKMEIAGDFWPATGQILYEMIEELELKTNSRINEAIWVAIWTDTEGLSQRSPSEVTIRAINTLLDNRESVLNKLNLIDREKEHISKLEKQMVIKNNICYLITEDIVPNDYIRQMTAEFSNKKGFEIYFGVTKVRENLYRGELRAKGNVDVSVFAKSFGGGGHFSSAGFKISSLDKAYENLNYIIKNQ